MILGELSHCIRLVVMKITEHVIKKINEVMIKWKVFIAEILNQFETEYKKSDDEDKFFKLRNIRRMKLRWVAFGFPPNTVFSALNCKCSK